MSVRKRNLTRGITWGRGGDYESFVKIRRRENEAEIIKDSGERSLR